MENNAAPIWPKQLPPEILFGTSSWNYPGWKGRVYTQEYKSAKDFTARALAEYVTYPHFRTVGIDSSFYTPLSENTLERYHSQVPTDFQWVSKAWERISIPEFPSHPRYGVMRGKQNPDFLNADLFQEKVLAPYLEHKHFFAHCGPIVFQFQALRSIKAADIDAFINRLDRFFQEVPTTFRFATEVRNREILTPAYFQVLNQHKVTHCFNHWTAMPSLRDQMQLAANAGGLTAPYFVARILTPTGVSYEGAVEAFAPYDSIKRPILEMRRDVVKLAQRAIKRKIPAFVLVNNRVEGHAPGTIQSISEMILETLDPAED